MRPAAVDLLARLAGAPAAPAGAGAVLDAGEAFARGLDAQLEAGVPARGGAGREGDRALPPDLAALLALARELGVDARELPADGEAPAGAQDGEAVKVPGAAAVLDPGAGGLAAGAFGGAGGPAGAAAAGEAGSAPRARESGAGAIQARGASSPLPNVPPPGAAAHGVSAGAPAEIESLRGAAVGAPRPDVLGVGSAGEGEIRDALRSRGAPGTAAPAVASDASRAGDAQVRPHGAAEARTHGAPAAHTHGASAEPGAAAGGPRAAHAPGLAVQPGERDDARTRGAASAASRDGLSHDAASRAAAGAPARPPTAANSGTATPDVQAAGAARVPSAGARDEAGGREESGGSRHGDPRRSAALEPGAGGRAPAPRTSFDPAAHAAAGGEPPGPPALHATAAAMHASSADSASGLAAPAHAAHGAPAAHGPVPTLDATPESLPRHVEWLAERGGGSARLRLDPPHLGEVELHVRLHGRRVEVFVTAHDEAARAALEGHRELLADSLASRGLRMEQLTVSDAPGRDAAGLAGDRPGTDAGQSGTGRDAPPPAPAPPVTAPVGAPARSIPTPPTRPGAGGVDLRI